MIIKAKGSSGGGSSSWGAITGTLSDQTDLQNALNLKQVANPGVSCATPISPNDIVIDYTARTLTIVPPLGYFDIIIDGTGSATRYRKTGNQIFSWTNTTGIWYFYYDSSGNAQGNQTAWSDFETVVPIYSILWDATKVLDADKSVSEGYEAHCGSVSGTMHKWMHAQKSIWVYGLDSVDNALSVGTPNASGLNTCVGMTSGQYMDDNLPITITNGTGTSKFMQNLGVTTAANLTISNGALYTIATTAGAGGTNLPATRFPFDWNSSTNIPNYIASDGTRTPVSNNYYFVYFLFVYQDPRTGQAIRLISAHQQFSTLTDARAYTWESLVAVFTGIGSSNEIRPLYRYIFEYKTIFDVAIKYTALREKADLRRSMVNITQSTGTVAGTSVVITPYGNISSTNVQGAIQELDDEKISWGGNTNGADKTIGSNDNFGISLETNGISRLTILNDGKIGVGTTLPSTKLTVLDTSSLSPRGILSLQINDGTDGARLGFAKARGTEAAKTIVQSGDILGRLIFRGYDGANFLEMASIDVGTSGTIATTRIPTYLSFFTATDAAPSVLTERARFDNAGNFGINTTTPMSLPALGFNQNANSRGLEIRSLSSGGYSSIHIRSSSAAVGLDITADPAVSGAVYFDSRYSGGGVPNGGFIFRTKTNGTLGTEITALNITYAGYIGVGVTPTKNLSFSGQTAQTLGLERITTANTAGVNFTINGGGATSGATDKNGGDLIHSSGIATGDGMSGITFQTVAPNQGSGTTDRNPTSKFRLTGDGGYAISLINKTGANTVKGTVVYADPDVDMGFEINPINGDMPIGVVLEDGIADGSAAWVVIAGIAKVLLVNSVATTRSYVAYSSATTAGRIDTSATVPVTGEHFREIGHTLESVGAGTNVLVRCILHFN